MLSASASHYSRVLLSGGLDMRRLMLLGGLLAVGSLSVAAAQQPAAPAGPRVIDILKLKDNLYVLTSSTPGNPATFSGGNVAVFITDSGVTLVDDKLAGWGQAVLDKVKSVTNKPITRIINTHTHGDHTGNNNFFGSDTEIIAQANTKTNMAKMDVFKGAGAQYLPTKTYTDKLTIGSGKDRIDLYYFGAGHTSGDAFVVFPALRVLHTGDMFAWKDGPLCDRNNGGSCVSFPQTLSKVIANIKDVDTVIPGHSPMDAEGSAGLPALHRRSPEARAGCDAGRQERRRGDGGVQRRQVSGLQE